MRKSFLEGHYGGKAVLQMCDHLASLIDTNQSENDMRAQAEAILDSTGLSPMDIVLSESLNSFIRKPNIFSFSDDFAKELNNVELDTHTSKINFNIKPTLIDIPGDMLQVSSPRKPYVEAFYIISEGDRVIAWILSNQADGVSEALGFSIARLKEENLTVKELINKLIDPKATFDQFDLLEKQLKFLFNALLYIQSGDPDLRKYVPPAKPLSMRERQFKKANKNVSLYPMTAVGYGYKKPNLRYAEESTVKGHFRWQVCGKERANVKLIWIAPHVRLYLEKED